MVLKQAKTDLYKLSIDIEERERYNMRKKAIYDGISALENAEKKDWSKDKKILK